MKDYLGNELKVGDNIVVVAAHGRNSGGSFVKGKILRMTEKTIFYEGSDYTGSNSSERERKCDPSKAMKIITPYLGCHMTKHEFNRMQEVEKYAKIFVTEYLHTMPNFDNIKTSVDKLKGLLK